MKKMNNKGFSLVELIIVIAIMAVLMGVLAPSLLKYVEDSRIQTDETAMAEVENAAKIALSVEEIYKAAPTSFTVDIADGAAVDGGFNEMTAELAKTMPATIDFTSKKYDTTSQSVTFEYTSTSGTFAVTNRSWDTASTGTTTP